MADLEVLEVGLLAAEDAEAVAPAERQLQDRELVAAGRDLLVDRGHARIGRRQRDREVLDRDERDDERHREHRERRVFESAFGAYPNSLLWPGLRPAPASFGRSARGA